MKKLFLVSVAVLSVLGCKKKNPDTIVAYGRENNSGTYMYFKEHVLENKDFASGVQTLPGTAAVIHAVSKDANAIGYGGIGYLKGVKALRVKKDASSPAVEPTLENVVNKSYPISRYLYFYTVGEPRGSAREYVAWVLGDEGQKICQEVGYYPLPADERKIPAALGGAEKTTITVKGSDTMVILGQRWAEHYMRQKPGMTIQITGGGSGTGIAALINGSTDICQSSRSMKDKEKGQIREKFGKDSVEIRVAMDGLAVFVHESNPLAEITLEQLRDIYTEKIKIWKELAGTR